MEVRAEYAGRPVERPRLTVVRDDGSGFSALPHDVLFSGLSDGEVRVYAAVQSFAWSTEGECTAAHETIAVRIGKEVRTVRRLLKSLVDKGYLTERLVGRGQAKAYRLAEIPTGQNRPVASGQNRPVASGQNRPVASGQNRPVSEPKRPKSATQQAKIGQSKRPKLAAPIKEDTEKKTQKEELPPPVVDAAGAAATAAVVVDQATILRSLSSEAREILDWHRQCHNRRQPAKLNPESARVLEAAVADLGVERLRESVRYMAAKIPPVPELSKALSAAKTKRQMDEGAAAPAATRRNGTPSPAARPGSIAARTQSERFRA